MSVFNKQLTKLLTILHSALMSCYEQAPAYTAGEGPTKSRLEGPGNTPPPQAGWGTPRGHTHEKAEPTPGPRRQLSMPCSSCWLVIGALASPVVPGTPCGPWPQDDDSWHPGVSDSGKRLLGGLEQRAPDRIYFCQELNGKLRYFSTVAGAFELPPIEQFHIFPRSKNFFK